MRGGFKDGFDGGERAEETPNTNLPPATESDRHRNNHMTAAHVECHSSGPIIGSFPLVLLHTTPCLWIQTDQQYWSINDARNTQTPYSGTVATL